MRSALLDPVGTVFTFVMNCTGRGKQVEDGAPWALYWGPVELYLPHSTLKGMKNKASSGKRAS